MIPHIRRTIQNVWLESWANWELEIVSMLNGLNILRNNVISDKMKSTKDFQTVLLLFHIISYYFCTFIVWTDSSEGVMFLPSLHCHRYECENSHMCLCVCGLWMCSILAHTRNTFICEILFSFCHWFRSHCYRCSLVFLFILGGIVRRQMLHFYLFYFAWNEYWTLNKMNEWIFAIYDARCGPKIRKANTSSECMMFPNEISQRI